MPVMPCTATHGPGCICHRFVLEYATKRDEAVKERDAALLHTSELLTALKHIKICGPCSEDAWYTCEGGRAALAAIEKAEQHRCKHPEIMHNTKTDKHRCGVCYQELPDVRECGLCDLK